MVSDINDGKQPLSDRQNEISKQILADEALGKMEFRLPPRLDLDADFSKPIYGPKIDGDSKQSQDDSKFRQKELKYNGAKLSKDDLVDKVIPGFGRIKSSDDSWRLDYIDPSGCSTRAKIGLCFRIKH